MFLAWAHVVVALSTTLIYFGRIKLGFTLWLTSGVPTTLIVAPVLIPYLVSAIYSWRVVTDVRWRVVSFILILFVGSVLLGVAIAGAFGPIQPLTLLAILGAQAWAYLWSAELLLHVV